MFSDRKNTLIFLGLAVAGIYILYNNNERKKKVTINVEEMPNPLTVEPFDEEMEMPMAVQSKPVPVEMDSLQSVESVYNDERPAGSESVQLRPTSRIFDSKDYLPQETTDKWFSTDFTQAEQSLNDNDMFDVHSFTIGVNTVGQSLGSPSYDIRGTAHCPKYAVSPWNNSTYEPDYNIKSWC